MVWSFARHGDCGGRAVDVDVPVTVADSGLWVDQSHNIQEPLAVVSRAGGMAELSCRYRDVHPDITDTGDRCSAFYGMLKAKSGVHVATWRGPADGARSRDVSDAQNVPL